MTKAATETDPAKKTQFIAIAQAAEQTIKQIRVKLNRNPLSKLAPRGGPVGPLRRPPGQYSYLNDIGRLLDGNIPSNHRPTQPNVNLPGDNSIPTGSGGGFERGNNSWTPWGNFGNNNPNDQSPNNQQLLIYGGIALLVILFLMNQKNHDEY